MDDAYEQEEKISPPVGIFGALNFGLFDLIGIALIIFGLDDFFILEILSTPVFLYLMMNGITPIYQLIALFVESIPWAGDILPTYSVGWIVTWWVANHPESATGHIVGTAAATTSVIRGAKAARGGPPTGKQFEAAAKGGPTGAQFQAAARGGPTGAEFEAAARGGPAGKEFEAAARGGSRGGDMAPGGVTTDEMAFGRAPGEGRAAEPGTGSQKSPWEQESEFQKRRRELFEEVAQKTNGRGAASAPEEAGDRPEEELAA